MMAAATGFATAVISCSREQLDPAGGTAPTAEIRFSSSLPGSRTQLEDGDVIWSAGDRIAVTYLASSTWASSFSTSEPLAEDCGIAEFTVPVELTASISSKTRFYAVYPASAVDAGTGIPGVSVTVPDTQSPADGNFDKAADLMWAYSEQTYSSLPEESVPLIWDRPLAHLDLSVKSLGISDGESISKIVVSPGSAIAGKCELDLRNGNLTVTEGSTSISIDPSNLNPVSDGNLHFLVPMLPGSLSSLTVDIHTGAGYYRKTINSTLAILANRRNPITLDFSGIEPEGGVDPELEALVNSRIFEIMDLDGTGLEEVKAYYAEGH
ncbi:MAG: fimbrillin family protein, partial [Candidatus Cryptobacteroides sp.]